MEKRYKPKDATYHSEKILGQLYDKVDSVDFIPQYQEPFDRRILRAYKLDNAILKSCRQIKSKYDTAMRRIMAQQEIRTEFEVWSTFVLSRPRVGTDYKVQEEMARYSDDLKARFREVCIEVAGSKDFAVLGPFVAGMYRVTKEELDIALAECRSTKLVGGREVPKRKMEPKYMPLMSFPWLFEKELARIATGIEVGDDLEAQGLEPLVLRGDSNRHRKREGGGEVDFDDFIQQDDGVIVHRGEYLDLFRPDVDSEDLSGESDFEEARRSTSTALDEPGEAVLATSPRPRQIPHHHLSGTGLEDVVPYIKLDGLTDPREAARVAHRSKFAHSKSALEGSSTDHPAWNAFGSQAALTESVPPAEDEFEEEMVELQIDKTPLEKLTEMMSLSDKD
jgi:RNA-dependent RNA polymerase